MKLVVDIETNGLLRELDRIHCVVARDVETSATHCFRPGEDSKALELLDEAELLIGHNILGFDIPAIQKLHRGWKPKCLIRDTLVLGRLCWPVIKELDFGVKKRNPAFPPKLMGSHSLEAYGWRLGVRKDNWGKTTDWAEFSEEMLAYCVQDTLVTLALWNKFTERKIDPRAIELEQQFARIISEQMEFGFQFDMAGFDKLAAQLQARRAELNEQLAKLVPDFVDHYVTEKKKLERTKTTVFNPGSRDQVARHLQERRGWVPTRFTDGGKPQVDEVVLSELPKEWPEVAPLIESFTIRKLLGQSTDGEKAWVKNVGKDGRIRGYVNHNGAVTSRCTHNSPNMAQVPKVGSPYGKECRALFVARPGFKIVGADASGLELRCLAHYMSRYDSGAYAKILLEGDIHTANQKAAGLDTRDKAKTFIYALLYGAGDAKIGTIVGGGQKEGRALKARFFRNMPALARLQEDIAEKVAKFHHLRGLDGRYHAVRHKHAALNTLLQSAGAVAMKKATVLLDEYATSRWTKFVDFGQCAHVHDEYQFEVREDIADEFGKLAVQAIVDAGKQLGFQCPLAGEYKVGNNWAETH